MTRRYNLSHPVGQPMPEDWIHLPDSVVAAADYDAISARLAEAEAILRDARSSIPGNAKFTLRRIDAFLGPAADAPACNHFPGQSTCEWCSAPALQPCGHPWKAQHNFKCILCSSPG
jgi:hypothetical protein